MYTKIGDKLQKSIFTVLLQTYRGVFDLRSMLCFVKFHQAVQEVHTEKCSIQLFAIEITLKYILNGSVSKMFDISNYAARGTRV